jgi:hypothetical protein
MSGRPLEELLDRETPAWPLIEQMIRASPRPVEVLPRTPAASEAALVALDVTTHSTIGAVTYETGGLLLDHGWVRVLGGGHPRLTRTVATWNQFPAERLPGALLVADDALGGFFALDCGRFEGELGDASYLAPDSLSWEPLGLGYTDLLAFLLDGDLERFYTDARWPGWQAEVAALGGDAALLADPALWADGPPISSRKRASAPVDACWALEQEFMRAQAPPQGPPRG